MRVAAVGNQCRDRHLGNISGFGCNIPRYDNCALWGQVEVLGDRASSGVATADTHWRGVKGSTFLEGFPIFSRWGSFGTGAVDGWGCSGYSFAAVAKANIKNLAADRSYQ